MSLIDISDGHLDHLYNIIAKMLILGKKNIKHSVIETELTLDQTTLKEEDSTVIVTSGINLYDIAYIKNIDINNSTFNDIKLAYELLGIEACRSLIINETLNTYNNKGITIDYSHYTIIADNITVTGTPKPLNRFGFSNVSKSTLVISSFEETIKTLLTASIHNYIDPLKSVSSRIISGKCINGGTTFSKVGIDTEMIMNSEHVYEEKTNVVSVPIFTIDESIEYFTPKEM